MSGFDETFDFVVVGSGGGSMCAAVVACSAGKTALVLEKTSLIGGTTARSGGVMWIPNNPYMTKAGVPDSLEAAVKYLEEYTGFEMGKEKDPKTGAVTYDWELVGKLFQK